MRTKGVSTMSEYLAIVGYLVGGLVVLTYGADILVRGASGMALRFGISALVVGLTVVAFGTSAPEMAVSVAGALKGEADLAIGNVVGSNIFNILFILGASALIVPLTIDRQLIRFDVPLMVFSVLLMYGMSLNGIQFVEGFILFGGLLFYVAFQVAQSRKQSNQQKGEFEMEASLQPKQKVWVLVGLVLIGLVMLVVGSKFFVSGAVSLAKIWGVSDLVIGLTIVAVGTSLPEVATSLMAAFKGERDIAVGNVVGSNIFNTFGVLGATALVSPRGLVVSETALKFDIPVMIITCALCLPLFWMGQVLNRWKGLLFFSGYIAYTSYLILSQV
jgi:cation:H+ antiporter